MLDEGPLLCSCLNVPLGLEQVIFSKQFVYKSLFVSYLLTSDTNHDAVHRTEQAEQIFPQIVCI